jgi:hypothetical protein
MYDQLKNMPNRMRDITPTPDEPQNPIALLADYETLYGPPRNGKDLSRNRKILAKYLDWTETTRARMETTDDQFPDSISS